MSWIQTYTGKRFFVLAPREDDVAIEDIAHALARLPRFLGHTGAFYSVAEHCVLASYQARDVTIAMGALLHDAPEAYLGDMPAPWKRHVSFSVPDPVNGGVRWKHVEDVEAEILSVIFEALGGYTFTKQEWDEVKRIDLAMLLRERDVAMCGQRGGPWEVPETTPPAVAWLHYWTPERAKHEYLTRFHSLQNQVATRAQRDAAPKHRDY